MQPQSLAFIQPSPSLFPSRIRVAPRGEHRCIEASERIAEGETVLVFTGRRVRHPDRYSVQVGPRTHIAAPDGIPWDMAVADYGWRHLNHSCEPNAYLRGVELAALADIPEGGEVTFDYNSTEWDMAHPFDCLCGTPSCVGVVRGYRHLDEAARARLVPFLARHLRLRTR
jgi:hypothetical protein